jgi:signal transduction histidine kinase
MAGKSSNSLRWLTLAVLLPLLVLGVLAWLGTRAQVRAAWSSAREEAKVAGQIASETLAGNLQAAVEKVKVYPDPPMPGTRSAADDVLDGDDLPALRRLRDDPDAGLSPAGLPRRVLAGFRIYEMTGDAADGDALLKAATIDAPSVLTPRAFVKVGGAGKDWPTLWEQAERLRDFSRQRPNVGEAGSWITGDDEPAWLAVNSESLRAISRERLSLALDNSRRLLPAWADLRFAAAGQSAKGEALAVVPVAFPDAGDLEIVAARPELLEAAARQQARWTLGLLAFAIVISGGALAFIHRAVERERRLNALKSDFVASVSHELRAPVASIRLMADALNAGKIEPHTVREFHRLISREGARLSTLIENVLDFARIEQGRKNWHFEPTDLGALLTETLGIMEPLAAEKNIALVSQSFPSVEANLDPGAIQQALVNLLDNAIKFSPTGSRVEIALGENGSNWEIRIADQGPGIPAAEHERVFQKFHRLGSELRRETQGTGIGLSLVKAVAEAHGGRVVLTSAQGQGCSFILSSPITRNK